MEKINNLKGQNQLPYYEEAYSKWNAMFNRIKHNITYKKVSIDAEWYTFSNFYNWYIDNRVGGWDLDKDMKGGNVYSADNCIMIPREVNLMFRCNYSTVGKGVGEQKNGKYQAQAKWNNKIYKFGTHDTIEQATAAYEAGRKNRLYDLSVQYSQYTELSSILYTLSK